MPDLYREAQEHIGELDGIQNRIYDRDPDTPTAQAAVLAQIAAGKGQIAALLAIADAIRDRNED